MECRGGGAQSLLKSIEILLTRSNLMHRSPLSSPPPVFVQRTSSVTATRDTPPSSMTLKRMLCSCDADATFITSTGIQYREHAALTLLSNGSSAIADVAMLDLTRAGPDIEGSELHGRGTVARRRAPGVVVRGKGSRRAIGSELALCSLAQQTY